MNDKQPPGSVRQRIDKWLFFTRAIKSRSLAQTFVESGKIRVNGERIRASSHQIKPGDRVEIQTDQQLRIFVMLLPGDRRGPFEEARKLYDDQSPPPPDRSEWSPLDQAVREAGSGRPVKKERRALDRFLKNPDWD
jgi:ribosome-associated heat shock protein Hsp15